MRTTAILVLMLVTFAGVKAQSYPQDRARPRYDRYCNTRRHVIAASYIRLAYELYCQAEYNAAIISCRRALELEPGNRQAIVLLNRIIKTKAILGR